MKPIISGRSISPIIAIVLLMGLAIAGAATTAIVYNNAVKNTPSINTEGTTAEFGGSANSQTFLYPSTVTSSIVEINQDPQTGAISSVKVQVTNNGNQTIYVQSADVSAGVPSSNAQWDITSVEGATAVDVNGGTFDAGDQFGGYAIAPGQTATFTVSETSGNPVNQIPQEQANLISVKLQAGDQPGINNIALQSSNIELIDPMAPRSINIALLRYPGKTTYSEKMWKRLLSGKFFEGSLETKSIDFQFDKDEDIFSFKRSNHGLNASELAENYDVVIIPMWAVHKNIADLVSALYDLGVPMVFYGSIKKFNANDIDFSLTEQIVGLQRIADVDDDLEEIQFSLNSDPINALAGLDLSNLHIFDDESIEIPEEDLVNATVATAIAYASSDEGSVVTALAYRDGKSRVVSSSLDPHEAEDEARSVFELVFPRNMLLAAIDEGIRLTQEGTINFESISFDVHKRHENKIRPTITLTVEDGDINLLAGHVTFEFTIPDGIDFELPRKAKARIQVESSGMSRVLATTDKIEKDGNVLTFTLKDYHRRHHSSRGDRSLLYLFEGDNISITLPVKSPHSLKWLEIDEDVDLSSQFDWIVSATWYGMDGNNYSATNTFTKAVADTSSPSQFGEQPIARDQS